MSGQQTGTATPSRSEWPFVVKAEIIAVPARPVKIGLALLAAILLVNGIAAWLVLSKLDTVASVLAIQRR